MEKLKKNKKGKYPKLSSILAVGKHLLVALHRAPARQWGGGGEGTVWLTDLALNGPLPLGGCWALTQFLVLFTRV